MVYICAVAQLVRRYCTIGRCCDAIPRKSVASLINHRLYSPSIQILNIALQFTNATTLEQMKQPLSFQHQQCVHGDRRETLSSVISPDWFASPCPLSHPITAGSKKFKKERLARKEHKILVFFFVQYMQTIAESESHLPGYIFVHRTIKRRYF